MKFDYTGQSDRNVHDLRVRKDWHRSACKSQNLRSKIFQHSINLGHKPNFSNPTILVKKCANITDRLFLEAFLRRFFKFTFNKAAYVFLPNMLHFFISKLVLGIFEISSFSMVDVILYLVICINMLVVLLYFNWWWPATSNWNILAFLNK